MCSFEENKDGLTGGADGNTRVRVRFCYVCSINGVSIGLVFDDWMFMNDID